MNLLIAVIPELIFHLHGGGALPCPLTGFTAGYLSLRNINKFRFLIQLSAQK